MFNDYFNDDVDTSVVPNETVILIDDLGRSEQALVAYFILLPEIYLEKLRKIRRSRHQIGICELPPNMKQQS